MVLQYTYVADNPAKDPTMDDLVHQQIILYFKQTRYQIRSVLRIYIWLCGCAELQDLCTLTLPKLDHQLWSVRGEGVCEEYIRLSEASDDCHSIVVAQVPLPLPPLKAWAEDDAPAHSLVDPHALPPSEPHLVPRWRNKKNA